MPIELKREEIDFWKQVYTAVCISPTTIESDVAARWADRAVINLRARLTEPKPMSSERPICNRDNGAWCAVHGYSVCLKDSVPGGERR